MTVFFLHLSRKDVRPLSVSCSTSATKQDPISASQLTLSISVPLAAHRTDWVASICWLFSSRSVGAPTCSATSNKKIERASGGSFSQKRHRQTVEQRRPPPTVIIMVFAFHRVSAQSVQPAGLEISHRNYEDYTTSLAHFYALLTQRCFFEASPPQRPPAPADPHFFQRDAQRAQRLMMAAFN